jgi:hypothetical protein
MKSQREIEAWHDAEILMSGKLDATSLADILQRRAFFARLDKSETVEVPLKIAKQIVSQLRNVKLPNHRPRMRFIERSERESLVAKARQKKKQLMNDNPGMSATDAKEEAAAWVAKGKKFSASTIARLI